MKIFWEAVALSSSHLCRPVAKNLAVGWGLLWAAVHSRGAPDLGGPPSTCHQPVVSSVNDSGRSGYHSSFSSSFGQFQPDGEGRRFPEKRVSA